MKMILMSLVMTLSSAIAQDAISIENQTVKAAKMGDGVYTSYVIEKNASSGEYEFAGCCAEHYSITFSEYTEGHKKFEMFRTDVPNQTYTYFPDEEAYPVTFVSGRYRGNAEMAATFKVVQRTEEKRIVFLDEWVYILEDWKNKDSYLIKDIYHIGEISGGKAVKEAFTAKKKMEKANHVANLQAYLDAATAKQQELLPKWTEDNKALIDERAMNELKVQAAIDGKNADYWNSPEGKRKQAEMSQSPITLLNDTGVDLLICYGSGAYDRLKPGEKKEFSCSGGGSVRKGSPRASNTSQHDDTGIVLFKRDGTNCGGVIRASSAN